MLLDLVLPGSDGVALMAEVPALAELPVIFISAYDRAETLARALDAGADDYLVEPFSATDPAKRDPRAVGEWGAGVDSRRLGAVDPSIQRRCHNARETAQTAKAARPGAPGRGMASGAIMARPHPANNAGTIQGDAGSGATRYVEQTRAAAGAGSPTKRSSSASTL